MAPAWFHFPLIHFHSLPEHLRDNQFIHKHYRADWPMGRAVASIFSVHNETGNIWTHLLGFLFFFGLLVSPSRAPDFGIFAKNSALGDESASLAIPPHFPAPRWPVTLFLVGATLCLLGSTMWHIFGCSSCHSTSRLFRQLDFAGIAVLVSSSYLPPVFYGFRCHPITQAIYFAAVVAVGAATVGIILLPSFQSPVYRTTRACVFLAAGVWGVIPCTHFFLWHRDVPAVQNIFVLELTMGFFYILGAVLYATKVPERWLPGKLDIVGHSHQIFHVLVLAGAYTHFRAGLVYLEWRDWHGCEAY